MGANTSQTRRLTVNNEDARIIQVTEDVVNRLRSSPPPTRPTASDNYAYGGGYGEPAVNSVPSDGPRSGQPIGVLNVGPDGHPRIETVTAYHVRQEKEAEIRNNDSLWKSKLLELEQRYSKSAFASQEEFHAELAKLQKLVPTRKPAPCMNMSAQVAQCYATNNKQPLKCAEEVRGFAQCVENVRAM